MTKVKGKELQKAMKSNSEILADIKLKKEIDLKKALKNCLENMNVMNEILLAYFTHAKRPNLTPEKKSIEIIGTKEVTEKIPVTEAILVTESDIKTFEIKPPQKSRTLSPALCCQMLGHSLRKAKKNNSTFSRIINLFKKNKK